jgi:Transposase DDE domain group 1
VKTRIRRQLAGGKRRIERRLARAPRRGTADKPVLGRAKIRYEISGRQRGIVNGGVGVFLELAKQTGLVEALDDRLHLLKVHAPYHESDHVLNFAFNALCDGRCLEDIELRRNDEAYLDALGADRIPDPTTAGDFCRRFSREHLQVLHTAIDEARRNVWTRQPQEFFERATIDFDGTLVATDGEKKQGVDIAYDGTWGYHPLICTLAETGEVLSVVNRPGNRPSHEGAAAEADRSIALCRAAGFRRIVLRGDTDFSQSAHLDGWDADGIEFVFGYDAHPNLVLQAEILPKSAWKRLVRPPRYEVNTAPRRKRKNVKQKIVGERLFTELRLESEDVAEFAYRPTACQKTYRLIVARKNLSVRVAQQRLFPDERYFFYITNFADETSEEEIVFEANDRCRQENLIQQLHGGCRALRAALDTLEANAAYMLMTALAWNLKAWAALWLPETPGRWQEQHREQKRRLLTMEFRTFVNAFVRLPCQIVRTGRQLIYRVLGWNPHLPVFFRLAHVLRC